MLFRRSGVILWLRGSTASNWSTVPFWGQRWGNVKQCRMILLRIPEVFVQVPFPVPHFPSQIPHESSWDWIRASAVKRQLLATGNLARTTTVINRIFISYCGERTLLPLQLFNDVVITEWTVVSSKGCSMEQSQILPERLPDYVRRKP